MDAVGVDDDALLLPLLLLLVPPPLMTGLYPLGDRMLSLLFPDEAPPLAPVKTAGDFTSLLSPTSARLPARPPKNPPSRPNPPLLGDLDINATPPPPFRGDLMGPFDSTGLRVLPKRGELAGERPGTVAPRDLAALDVLTRDAGPAGETAGATTVILAEAGDRAMAAAAVTAAEAGIALRVRGATRAPAAGAAGAVADLPVAAAATAVDAGSSQQREPPRPEIEVGEGDGDEDDPAVATSSPRTCDLPLRVPLPPIAAVLVDAEGPEAPATGFTTLFVVPTPAALETLTLLRRWAGVAVATVVLEEEDLTVPPPLPEAAAAASAALANLSASRSAALLASTRAAARSTAGFGEWFLESADPLPPPPPPLGVVLEALFPAMADEERLSPLLLFTARLLVVAVDAPHGFVGAPAVPFAGAVTGLWLPLFRAPLFTAKPPLIQPLSRLNESFTWYLPLRGEEAVLSPRPEAIRRRSETLFPRARPLPRPVARRDLPSSDAGTAAAPTVRTPDRVCTASDSSTAESMMCSSIERGRTPVETERR